MIQRTLLMGMLVAAPALVAHAGVAKDKNNDGGGYLGVYLGSVGDEDLSGGAKILGVIDDSPASGILEDGDVVIAINGDDVGTYKELVKVIGDLSPGDETTIDVDRDGREVSVVVVLGERPANIAFGKGHKAIIELMGDGKNHQHAFKWRGLASGKGPHGEPSCWLGVFGGADMPDDVREALSDLSGENVEVNVDCENGDCEVVVERDGDREVYEFQIDDNIKTFGHTFSFDIPDTQEIQDKIRAHLEEIDLGGDNSWYSFKNLHDLSDEDGNFKFFGNGKVGDFMFQVGKPATTIEIKGDGEIRVVTRKGDTELVRSYDNEADFKAQSSPELYDKYLDLLEAEE